MVGLGLGRAAHLVRVRVRVRVRVYWVRVRPRRGPRRPRAWSVPASRRRAAAARLVRVRVRVRVERDSVGRPGWSRFVSRHWSPATTYLLLATAYYLLPTLGHHTGHVRRGIADVDLTDRDREGAACGAPHGTWYMVRTARSRLVRVRRTHAR